MSNNSPSRRRAPQHTSIRFSKADKELIRKLDKQLQLGMAPIIRLALRELASAKGIKC